MGGATRGQRGAEGGRAVRYILGTRGFVGVKKKWESHREMELDREC
jgi:hypothetical protein